MTFMKLNKKIIILYISLVFLIIGIILFCVLNNVKKVYCQINNENNKSQINIKLNKSIKTYYNYSFDTMDSVVDKYDDFKKYLNLINNIEGVETDIEQEELKLNYYININLNKISKDDYELLGIKDLMKNKTKKDIISYYEKQSFECK